MYNKSARRAQGSVQASTATCEAQNYKLCSQTSPYDRLSAFRRYHEYSGCDHLTTVRGCQQRLVSGVVCSPQMPSQPIAWHCWPCLGIEAFNFKYLPLPFDVLHIPRYAGPAKKQSITICISPRRQNMPREPAEIMNDVLDNLGLWLARKH